MTLRQLTGGTASIALALSMVISTASAVEFVDVPVDHWASSAIAEVSDRGIMEGIGGDKFAPDKLVSNAEFFTMLVRYHCPEKVAELKSGDPWWLPYYEAAESAGILRGTKLEKDEFLIEVTMDRYDMAQAVFNVMGGDVPSDVSIPDWASIPTNYRDAVAACYSAGMLTGVDDIGTFNGAGEMNRAQAATVMERLESPSAVETDPSNPVTPGVIKELVAGDITLLDGGSYSDGAWNFPWEPNRRDDYGRSPHRMTLDVTGYDFLRVTRMVSDTTGGFFYVHVFEGANPTGDLNCHATPEKQVGSVSATPTSESTDISGLSQVTLVTYSGSNTGAIKFELGTYAKVEHSIPAGAMELTDKNTELHGESSYYQDGVFYLKDSGMLGTAYLEFETGNYKTLTFTVTARRLKHSLTVHDDDGALGVLKFHEYLAPGETQTYTVDIADVNRVSMGARNGCMSDVELSSIYLS